MDLFDLFSPHDKELAKKIFTAPHHLIDLKKTPDEELEKFFWFGTMARTLKHIHDSDILPFFETRLWPFFLREISLIFNWLFADKRIKSSLLFLFAQPELI